MPRPLSTIAADIRAFWPKPSVHAKPYIEALFSLESISDSYYADSAREVVLRFLCNASGWRGPQAQAIKGELNALLKGVR